MPRRTCTNRRPGTRPPCAKSATAPASNRSTKRWRPRPSTKSGSATWRSYSRDSPADTTVLEGARCTEPAGAGDQAEFARRALGLVLVLVRVGGHYQDEAGDHRGAADHVARDRDRAGFFHFGFFVADLS